MLEFNAHPEDDQTKELLVINRSSEPLNLKIYQSDFLPEDRGLEQELPPGVTNRSSAKWVSLSEKGYVHIPPHTSKKVQVSIQVPKGAKGLYWSKIFFEEEIPSQKTPAQGMQLIVRQRYEVKLYEKVPNTNISKGEISSLSIIPPQGSNPLSIELTFNNLGNSLLSCSGEVQIKKQNGSLLYSFPLENESGFLCYPSFTRTFQVPLLEALPKGTYTALANIYYGSGKSLKKKAQFSFPRKAVSNLPSLLINRVSQRN